MKLKNFIEFINKGSLDFPFSDAISLADVMNHPDPEGRGILLIKNREFEYIEKYFEDLI